MSWIVGSRVVVLFLGRVSPDIEICRFCLGEHRSTDLQSCSCQLA